MCYWEEWREKAREKRNDVTNVHVNSSNRQCVQHNDEKEHGNKWLLCISESHLGSSYIYVLWVWGSEWLEDLMGGRTEWTQWPGLAILQNMSMSASSAIASNVYNLLQKTTFKSTLKKRISLKVQSSRHKWPVASGMNLTEERGSGGGNDQPAQHQTDANVYQGSHSLGYKTFQDFS